MPRPIILLEHHFRSGARRFVADNMGALKRLGYTQLLLEMDSSVSPETFKQQTEAFLAVPASMKNTPVYLSSLAMQRTFDYTLDEDYSLTASTVLNDTADEQTTSTQLRTTFPGLAFFTHKQSGKHVLHIANLNLPENHQLLTKAFKLHGVMRS